jgi:hypothetical protein
MSALYMIVLEGGGDVIVKLVDQETYDWLDSPRPKMIENSALDKSCPEAVRQRAYQEYVAAESHWPDEQVKPYEEYWPYVTSGSCENDRALWVPASEVAGAKLDFSDVADATNWCVEHGIKVNGSWNGCIY